VRIIHGRSFDRDGGAAGELVVPTAGAVLEVMAAVLCVEEELLKSVTDRPEELNVPRDENRIGSPLSPSEIRSVEVSPSGGNHSRPDGGIRPAKLSERVVADHPLRRLFRPTTRNPE
jgi:hypothetical protein